MGTRKNIWSLGKSPSKSLQLLLAFSAMLVVSSACSRRIETTEPKPQVNESGQTNKDRELPKAESFTRLCTNKILNTSAAKMSDFFGQAFSRLEYAPTWCLLVNDYGDEVRDSSIRIELEEASGISGAGAVMTELHAYELQQIFHVLYGRFEIDPDTSVADMHIIFRDAYGLLELKANGPSDADLSGTLKYYNFPSAQDALEAELAAAREDCQDAIENPDPETGHTAYVKCWGYAQVQPAAWWLQENPLADQRDVMEEMAIEIFEDATKAKMLGDVTFKINDVTDSN